MNRLRTGGAVQRRKAKRWARRLQVNFWQKGDQHTYSGYTTNLSSGGMFIGTNHPLRPGVRVRIEVVDPEHGFMVEGVVAHARRIAPELRKLGDSGMGIRFLTMDELVESVLPTSSSEARQPSRQRSDTHAQQSGGSGATAAAPQKGVYEVRFVNVRKFLEIYHRDITNGGLFIYTDNPPQVDQTVSVELFPPLKDAHSFQVEARVVHRFEPKGEGASGSKNLLAGMGVEFTDPQHVLDMLNPILQRLEP